MFMLAMAAIFLASCSYKTNLSSNSLVQKRRYTKGFHLNMKSSITENAKLKDQNAPERIEPLNHELEASKDNEERLKNLKPSPNLIFEVEPTPVPEQPQEKKEEATTETKPSPSLVTPLIPSERPSFSDRSNIPQPAPPAPNTAMSKLLVIIITILLPPLGVALVFGLSAEFWISLLLTLLFYVPGLIYSLIIILAEY
jgi:uncharacterized membrane protein YqaE (UPF0057 family)